MEKFRIKPIVVAISGVLAFPMLAYAASNSNLETESVEVVGQTPLATLGVPINEVPSNVQVATSKDIAQQQAANLADYLQNNIGSVNISNGTGSPFQPDVEYRGFTASPQLGQPAGLSVFFDGVRFNEPLGDIVNWDLIPMNAISSINLMPGSNPLFGLNTLGGALAITTKNGADNPGGSITLMGGSWGTGNLQFEDGGVIKEHNLDYFIAGNYYHTDGWREGTPQDIRQMFGKGRWHNDDNTSNMELTLALADNVMNQGQNLPVEMLNNPSQAYTGPDWVKNKMAFINLKGSTFLSDTRLLEGNVYYRLNNARSMNSNAAVDNCFSGDNSACVAGGLGAGTGGNTGSGSMTNAVDGSNAWSNTYQTGYGTSIQYSLFDNLFGHGNKLTTGASLDVSYVTYKQNTFIASLVGDQTVNDPANAAANGTPYLQDAVDFRSRNYYSGIFATDSFSITDKLNLTASARYNVAQVRLSGTDNNYAGGTTTSLDGSHTYNRLNPAIGITYNPFKSLGFYGGYNEGMRAPNALELECSDPSHPCTLPVGFTADPNLKEVVSKTWEGGVRGQLGQSVRWNVGLFNTNTYNDIQFAYNTSALTGIFSNVGETQRRGIEMGLSAKFDQLSLSARYSFVDATYQSSFTMPTNSQLTSGTEQIIKGDYLPGIARNTLKLRAAYDITPQWNIGTNVMLASGQWAHGDEFNQDPSGRVPGYGYVNLDSHYKINDSWQVFAKVDNIFDKQYSTYGILAQSVFTGNNELFVTPSMPRAGWVGVTYSFGGAKKSGSVDND
jgi:iron complex outermembrane receptor protein